MLFHEVYGSYYQTVSKILALAVKETLTAEQMQTLVRDNAFSESPFTIIPALEKEEWKLMHKDYSTPIKHQPSVPLTLLEKRWLKAISQDARIKLFQVPLNDLEDVEPLFTKGDYVVFDQYSDGDAFGDPDYINRFHTILHALVEKKRLHIKYQSGKRNTKNIFCNPCQLEYSQKDNKFRLLINGCSNTGILNLGRIKFCEITTEGVSDTVQINVKKQKLLVLEVEDERNALERALLHFSHFEREAEKLEDKKYRISLHYMEEDETELVIRVLSFGPMVKAIEPDNFINLIKDRLKLQKSCGLK